MHARTAVAANFASFAVLGVSGVATNIVLSRAFGADMLGAFNQILSIYIVGAQVAAGGGHLAAIRLVPLHVGNAPRQLAVLVAAAVMALGLSTLVVMSLLVGRPWLGALFDSELVDQGLLPLTVALAFSGLNKVLLGALNATERHVSFAVLQGLRPLAVLVGVVILWRMGSAREMVFLLLPAAELVVLATSLALVWPLVRLSGLRTAWRSEIKEVWRFAMRVFPGGLIAELNSRIDVLVLGVLGSDRLVGVYSFAAMYAEGLAQLPSVIRNAVSARMARLSGDAEGLRRELPKLIGFGYRFLSPVFIVAALAFYAIAGFSLPAHEVNEALAVFGIVAMSLLLAAGVLPLDMLLAQLGYPGWMSGLRAVLFVVNLVGCILLFQVMGVYGVALSVGVSYIAFPLGALLLARRLLRRTEHGAPT